MSPDGGKRQRVEVSRVLKALATVTARSGEDHHSIVPHSTITFEFGQLHVVCKHDFQWCTPHRTRHEVLNSSIQYVDWKFSHRPSVEIVQVDYDFFDYYSLAMVAHTGHVQPNGLFESIRLELPCENNCVQV